MTPDGVYIRISDSTKAPHWLPQFLPDTLLLQEIAYQTYVNGVVASLHKNKKGLWPPFLLSMGIHRIENFKQDKEEIDILSSFKLKGLSFRRHDPQGKLKEHLQHVGFVWSYAHEDLLPGELSQQHMLLKFKILTPNQMVQIDKQAEIQKFKAEKRKASIERRNLIRIEDEEEESSSSSMLMYSLDSDGEDSYVPLNRSTSC